MDAKEQARALVGEVLDGALEEAKKYSKPRAKTTTMGGEAHRFKGKPRKGQGGGSLSDEGDEQARGRLIGWLIKRGVIKRRGKPGGSSPAKGGQRSDGKKRGQRGAWVSKGKKGYLMLNIRRRSQYRSPKITSKRSE